MVTHCFKIEVYYLGEWSLYARAYHLATAKRISNRLSWTTRIKQIF